MDFDLYIFTNAVSVFSIMIVTEAFIINRTKTTLLRLLLIPTTFLTFHVIFFYINAFAWQNAFGTLLFYLLMILVLAYVTKSDLSTAVILSGINIIIIILSETISYSVFHLVLPYSTSYDRVLVFSSYVAIIPLVTIIRLAIIPKFLKIYQEKLPYLKNYAIVIVNCYVLYAFSKEFAHKNNALLSVYLLFILIFTISIMYLIKELTDKRSLQGMIQFHQHLIETIQPIIHDIRSSQHDFRNQLNVLKLQHNFVSDNSKALEHVEKLSKEADLIDSFTSFGGNIVSALLYLKYREAIGKNIKFVVNQPSFSCFTYRLTDYELISILSNLIDNAIEATSNFSGQKKVVVSFDSKDNGTLISISNTGNTISSRTLSKLFKRGYSTKNSEGAKQHGYGLYNVKKILDAYGEKVEVLCENNLTTFRIHLVQSCS